MSMMQGETMSSGRETYPWEKSYHPDVSWDLALEAFPLYELMDRAVSKYGEKVCTWFQGREMSYIEIGDLVNRAAKGLQDIGVEKGTKVGLMFPNTPAFIVFYYAVLKAGGVVVNYNPLYTVPELEYQIKDSETQIMVTHDIVQLFTPVEKLLASGALNKAVICPIDEFLPEDKSLVSVPSEAVDFSEYVKVGTAVDFRDLISNDGEANAVDIDVKDDVAVLQYTGGTTGRPKGAMLTHANLSINVVQCVEWYVTGVEGEEKILTILPLFHAFGMTGIMNFGVLMGAELTLMPKFNVEETLRLIEERQITILRGVPTIFIALMNYPEIKNSNLKSLKYCYSGGAPIPVEIATGFAELSGTTMSEGYGLSETSPGAVSSPIGGVRFGSIGVPFPGTVVSIRSLDDPEKQVPLGERGEICIKGPQVMKGYWKRPDATNEVMLGDYLRTGDVGYMDDDGYIYIVDRIKDMILCSGYNVYPRQIEEAIYEHDAIEEVIVIGIPNEYRGEAPKAFIKLKEDQAITADELMEFLKPRLSKIELPEEIEFRDELPKTSVGKLSKKDLRQSSQG